MTRLLRLVKNLPLAMVAMITLTLSFTAQGGDVPLPMVPKAKAQVSDTQACVEPIEEMRKNHMEYILHQRDETMHRGIRTRQYALEECINCHVPDNTDVRAGNPEHFCSSCHSYASVQIDCFDCHADRPVKTSHNSMTSDGLPHQGAQLSLRLGLPNEALKVQTGKGGN